MKNHSIKLLASVLLAFVMVMGLSSTAFAGTVESTTATVEFKKDESINKLELVTAPAFNFGEKTLPTVSETYKAESINGSLKVMDTSGDYDGWNVTASMTNFATDSSTNSLPGAVIELVNGTALQSGNSTALDPTVKSPIKLTSGNADAVPIVSADINKGVGNWDINWGKDDASLKVPANPKKGVHIADINWTLGSGPSI